MCKTCLSQKHQVNTFNNLSFIQYKNYTHKYNEFSYDILL
jgi:hypothetical protein